MIDIKVVKDSYQRNDIQNIIFIRSEYNSAEALTKIKRCPILDQIFTLSQLDHTIGQWIDK